MLTPAQLLLGTLVMVGIAKYVSQPVAAVGDADFCCYWPPAKKLTSCAACTEKHYDIEKDDCQTDKTNTWCPGSSPPSSSQHLRVNQVGFTTTDEKLAYLMAKSGVDNPVNLVRASDKSIALTMKLPASGGKWNDKYPNVYVLNFTSFVEIGAFYLEAKGANRTATFSIRAHRAELFTPLLHNSVFFYQVQRDGDNVNSSVYERKPSHLTDKSAIVYDVPTYKNDDLKAIPRVSGAAKRDCSGGWLDAGDFIKFVETVSYTVALMLASVRDYPASSAILKDEARFGLDWLVKMWDSDTKTLYYQVGIGNGGKISGVDYLGDHDLLRLPEDDDALNVKPEDTKNTKFFIKYRPCFRAADGGEPVSPNLAGRMAAAFAIGAQLWADSDQAFAAMLRTSAEDIFSLANTNYKQCDGADLFTTSPFDFYGEDEWCSDMELGASALFSLTKKSEYLDAAKKYANMYTTYFDGVQLFNLYDVAALAHAHLARQLPKNDPVRQGIMNNFYDGLRDALESSKDDVFGLGMKYSESSGDAMPAILGLSVTALLYDDLTGESRFAAFAQRQLDWALGSNGWGVSFVIGAAYDIKTATFLKCPQHNVDNILGVATGHNRILLGAVPDGPSTDHTNIKTKTKRNLRAGSSMLGNGDDFWHPCPPKGTPDIYKEFTRSKWYFQDNVDNWACSEPADDYTAMSVILWARLMNGKPNAM